MFGKGNKDTGEEKEAKFLENGFGIKRLFGQVAKAKNRWEDSVGSYSIDLADSDSATPDNSDSEVNARSESGDTNRIEEKFNMAESNNFHDDQNEQGETEHSGKHHDHGDHDENHDHGYHGETHEHGDHSDHDVNHDHGDHSDHGENHDHGDHSNHGENHDHSAHDGNGSYESETFPETTDAFGGETQEVRPEPHEAFSAEELVQNSLDSEVFKHTGTEPFQVAPDSPHVQVDEVDENGFENREVVFTEESSDVNGFRTPAEFLSNGNNHAVTVLGEAEESILPEQPEPALYEEADVLTKSDLQGVKSPKKFLKKLKKKNLALKSITKILEQKEEEREYSKELRKLQLELVKMQNWVKSENKRVVVLFEGLDSIGNRSVIRSFVEYLNPRATRVVALPKPTKDERGQLYFHRYAKNLPSKGEIVFFDRSWYDRAIIEPVNKFCTAEQYGHFLRHAPDFEHMLFEDGTHLVKFWFAVSKKELGKRIKDRKKNPLLNANLNAIDSKVKKRWSDYKNYRELMLSRTHSVYSPWTIVNANDQKAASLQSIKHFLAQFDYKGKDKKLLKTNSGIVFNCERPAVDIS